MTQTIDKNVLIITYHMIPNTKYWAASQRMYILAEQLMDNCDSVKVLHANYGFHGFFGKTPSFSMQAIDIKPSFFQKSQEHNQQIFSVSSEECKKIRLLDKIIPLVKKLFGGLHSFLEKTVYNDWSSGIYVRLWCIQAWPVVKKIIDNDNISHVIISGPYFTTFSIGEKIKSRNSNIKLVLDYRDPWNFLPSGSSLFSRYKEKRYLNIADKVTVFSETMQSDIVDKYCIPKEKVIAMYNGYDKTSWSELDSNHHSYFDFPCAIKGKKKMVVSYISSNISLDDDFRDVTNLLKALSAVKTPSIIELNLVGVNNIDDFRGVNLLNPKINLIERVPHKTSLEILLQSDVVIVLSTEDKPSLYTVTGKLFDCIKSGAFVLGISNDSNIEYNKIINKYGLGSTVSNELDQLVHTFNSLICLWQQNDMKLPRNDNIPDFFSRQYQNKKLIEYIKGN